VGSSGRELRAFPDGVKRIVGYALRVAQQGGKHLDAKPLTGYKGAGVIEIVVDFSTDTYRTIYTANCPDVIFVLHAFKKKSKRGSATPKPDLELIRIRHRQALNICKSQPTELARLIAEYGIAMTTYRARLISGVHPRRDRHP
jgi:phage-related protein